MNEIVNKSFLAEDKFRPELNLTQLGFIYNARGPLT